MQCVLTVVRTVEAFVSRACDRCRVAIRRVVQELFQLLLAEPECLPTEWRLQAAGAGTPATARLVADYIAGMTDVYIEQLWERCCKT